MCVESIQREFQELGSILPSNLTFRESLTVGRRWRWIGNLRNEIGCRCFRDAVDQHAKDGDLEEDVKAYGKTKQQALTVAEPACLLLFRELDP